MTSETFVKAGFGTIVFGLILIGFTYLASLDLEFESIREMFNYLVVIDIIVIVIGVFLLWASRKF